MAFWDRHVKAPRDLEDWRESIRLACEWVTHRSMMRTAKCDLPGSEYGHVGRYKDWRGAFRGEYDAAQRRWDVYAPIWHGGQGVKALAYAGRALGEPALIEQAKYAAEFILRHQVTEAGDGDFACCIARPGTSAISARSSTSRPPAARWPGAPPPCSAPWQPRPPTEREPRRPRRARERTAALIPKVGLVVLKDSPLGAFGSSQPTANLAAPRRLGKHYTLQAAHRGRDRRSRRARE